MLRQITESVLISKIREDNLMNSAGQRFVMAAGRHKSAQYIGKAGNDF